MTIFFFHLDPAKILTRQNSTVQVGSSTALRCLAEGNPTPTITWTRDKTDEGVGSGSTLVFCSAQLYDRGWYTCNSKNSVGPSDRASIYVEVRGEDDNQLSVSKMSGDIKNYHKNWTYE